MDKTIVVVARQWKETNITHTVCYTDDAVKIECPLDEFISALMLHGLNKARLTLTGAQLEKQLRIAASAVVMEMKQSTVHVPPPAPTPS